MYNCITYNCSELEDHEYLDCGDLLLGGIPGAVFLDCNHELTDPTSAAQINAEVAAGRAKIVLNVMIGVPAASDITVPRLIAGRPDTVVNRTRTFTIKDENVTPNNVTFYNSLWGGRELGGVILYEGEDNDQVTWIDKSVTGTGSRIIPENTTEQQRFEGTFTWLQKEEPAIHQPAPVGIFIG